MWRGTWSITRVTASSRITCSIGGDPKVRLEDQVRDAAPFVILGLPGPRLWRARRGRRRRGAPPGARPGGEGLQDLLVEVRLVDPGSVDLRSELPCEPDRRLALRPTRRSRPRGARRRSPPRRPPRCRAGSDAVAVGRHGCSRSISGSTSGAGNGVRKARELLLLQQRVVHGREDHHLAVGQRRGHPAVIRRAQVEHRRREAPADGLRQADARCGASPPRRLRPTVSTAHWAIVNQLALQGDPRALRPSGGSSLSCRLAEVSE